jgi:DNA (cytosine-5)-methyltransferase 1
VNELHLFAGAGGGILGGMLLGHTCVCAVEIEPYCRKILLQRQRDGILPKFPIWDDVRTFDGKPWRGRIDVVCGGFPCQDISECGKGAGIDGERSGLWSYMARIIGDIRPRFVFVENSPALVGRGLTRVLSDLARVGPYDVRWGRIGADDCSAPHVRKRCWLVGLLANATFEGLEGHSRNGAGSGKSGRIEAGQDGHIAACRMVACEADVADASIRGRWSGLCEAGKGETNWAERKSESCDGGGVGGWSWAWPSEPNLPRMAYGVADRLDREKATGNGQVPRVAALAWETLKK